MNPFCHLPPLSPGCGPMRRLRRSASGLGRHRHLSIGWPDLRGLFGRIYPLVQFGGHAGFALQHAINFEPGGPVHDAAHAAKWQSSSPTLALVEGGHLEPETGHSAHAGRPRNDFCSVSVTPDGRRAVSGSRSKTLRVWDLESGACLRTLEGHRDQVFEREHDARRAARGVGELGQDAAGVGLGERHLSAHAGRAPRPESQSVSMTPDGRRAVSGSWDKTLRVWDLESGAGCALWRTHR